MAARRLPTLLSSLAIAALLTARATAEGDASCDEGWTRSGSRCFKYFNEKKAWADAEKSCHTAGANLPSVHSADDDKFLVDLIVQATGDNTAVWLGGTDAVEEGNWLWSDGSPWDFTLWPSSVPNNYRGIEHCLMMNWNAKSWNDAPNSLALSYVCAKAVPQSSLQPTPEPKEVSLTLEGFICHCSPQPT